MGSLLLGKLLGYTSWMQIKDVAPSFIISMVMALIVYSFKYLPISQWIILPIQIVVGFCTFSFLCKIIKTEESKDVVNMISSVLNKIKK